MVILLCSSCRCYSYIRSSSHFIQFQSRSHLFKLNPSNFSISLSSGCNFTPHHVNIPTPFSTLTSSQIDNTRLVLQPPDILTPDSCDEFVQVPNTRIKISIDRVFYPPGTDIDSFKSSSGRHLLRGSNIVVTKSAMDSSVKKVEFVKSSTRTEDCPSDGMPEFAVVGRSNVGKSSLLNSLFRRKRLALTSKKPGKTQCINHFRVNEKWYFVDLPGYGYASAPKTLRFEWQGFTKDYFLNRSSLVCVFLLVDANVPTKEADMEYAMWLGRNGIPMTLIFTKCDKRKNKKCGGRRPEDTVKLYDELLSKAFEAPPPWIMTSSVTHQGRDEMLIYISQLRNYWLKH